jgi:hypothetical protein
MKIIQIFIVTAAFFASFKLEGASAPRGAGQKKSRIGQNYLDSDSSGSEKDLHSEHEADDPDDSSGSRLQLLTEDPDGTRGLMDFFSKKKKKSQHDAVPKVNYGLLEENRTLDVLLDRMQDIMLHDTRAETVEDLITRFEEAMVTCAGQVELRRDRSPYFKVSGSYYQESDLIEISVDRVSEILGRLDSEGALRVTDEELKKIFVPIFRAIYSRLGGHRISWKVPGLEGFPREIAMKLEQCITEVLDAVSQTGALLRELQEPQARSQRAPHDLGIFTLKMRGFSLADHVLGRYLHKGKLISLRDGRPVDLGLVPRICIVTILLTMVLWSVYTFYENPVIPLVVLSVGFFPIYKLATDVPGERRRGLSRA